MKLKSFILKSPGLIVEVLNLGGIIRSIKVPDKNGNFENVVLGYKDLKEYENNPSYLGAIVGRTAGRIANGEFRIGNNKYILAKNNKNNNLHGGNMGFSKVIWEVLDYTENRILLSYTSRDGEEGFPGKLEIEAEYRIENENELVAEYRAVSDKDTIVDITQHSYFNLSGNGKRTSLDHYLKLPAEFFVGLDSTGMVSGVREKVENTPFDFRNMKKIEENIDSDNLQIKYGGGGYDHPFLLESSEDIQLYDKESGRKLTVRTDAPAVIFYNSAQMDTDMELLGNIWSGRFMGACLETQNVPNAINFPDFKSPILKKGDVFKTKTVYKFTVEK